MTKNRMWRSAQQPARASLSVPPRAPHRWQCGLAAVLAALLAGCGSAPTIRKPYRAKACSLPVEPPALVAAEAEGVRLALPPDARGPFYDGDDLFRVRPTWEGKAWRVHFVFGNGGLTEFMPEARCCLLHDEAMRRTVCIGRFIRYGAMADLSRVDSPSRATSVQVSIETGGLSEADALAIVGSIVFEDQHP